ncbi:MAG TPA: TetR family transcriptional regulator [Acidimicrobiales bacterium]|nr:TetR family transcriptional regulator [Acidimicrobiales bacterium]
MAADEGLRARKKRETARRIESAALDLFERDGFDATTVDAIAAAADIAPRTFFHYFPTKEDVVLADYADRLERVLGQLQDREADEPAWRAVGASFRAVAEDYERERRLIVRRFRIMAETPSVAARSLQLQAGWEQDLAEVVTGRDVPAPTARLLAAAAVAGMRAALEDWLGSGTRARLPDVVQAHFDHLGRGLDQPPSP